MTTTLTIQPVILCGGSGTRLWPLSRAGFPKQFLSLTGDDTLFQQAAHRLAAISADGMTAHPLLLVSNAEHRFLAAEQLREAGLPVRASLLEPVGRNTAPALTLAALAARQDGEDPILVVAPSDQTILDTSVFVAAMQRAVTEAADGAIVILGIPPDHPETGYGYIKAVEGAQGAARVERFVEKPDRETAARYLAEGGYYWNAGMFVLKASVWLEALEQFRPDIAAASAIAWDQRTSDGSFIRPGAEAFAAIPAESIDYAVMENCPGSRFPCVMVPLAAGWSDLGAWDAVWKTLEHDANGNVLHGDVISVDSRNNLVHGTGRLVALVGANDLVVVETPDAVLVAHRDHSQAVKTVVAWLQEHARPEYALHRKVYRPWGWYDSIDEGGRFKVKRIQVNPKASLSLQMHHHRAEHWVVVKGTAEVINGDQTVLLSENQSTYIPLGATHRLSNPGSIPLEIIEVQSGSYLGEDDIVRFEDNYGR